MCGCLMPVCPALAVAQHDMEPVGEIISGLMFAHISTVPDVAECRHLQ